jgi:NADPH:quinone reductase-like Zn-dependent oxidoreductase
MVLPATNAAIVPDTVSTTDAAAIPLAGTSAWIPIVEIAKVSDGMEVLVHAGAGGVGSLAIQIARARGAQVTATCSERNAELVSSFGAHRVIAYDRVPFEKQVGDIDVVFDTMGGDIHHRSYEVLKRGGMMVCLDTEPFVNLGAQYGVTVVQAPILPRRDILESLLGMAEAGTLRVFVEQVLPITEFRQAQELSQGGHVRGKIVLQLRGPNGTPVG